MYQHHNFAHNDLGIESRKPLRLKCFDVNSLYPFKLKNFAMPTGKPVAFEGNIRSVDPKAFGFFFCKITSPEFILHPILQRNIKDMRTVAGIGSWGGWISSFEGYSFLL